MSDTTHTIGSSGIVKKLVDLGDSTYADAVVNVGAGTVAEDTVILAAPTGSAGGLGKLSATLANTEVIYVRFDARGRPYSYVDWITTHAQQADLAFFKARSIVDNITVTLASMADGETGPILNGLTYTAEDTAGSALWSTRYYYTGGADDTADAVQLAKLINADYSVVTAGTSVAATDKLVITTDEGAHTIVAAAAADYPAGKYKLDATAATELASIILAINHSQNVTCASSIDDDTVTVNGQVFTSAAAEDLTAGEFDNDSNDNDTATSLAACINDATYGVDGVTAVASANVVYLYRDSESDSITLSSSDGTTLACVTTVGGVPGVTAVATGGTAELGITPTWTSVLTVTESGARLTVTDIDCPGVYAESALGVVTLVPGGPASQAADAAELATVLHAVTGTAAGHCAVSQAATLAGLITDGGTTAVANEALTTGTAGTSHAQAVGGWEYLYLGLTADNATPQAVSVSVVPRI